MDFGLGQCRSPDGSFSTDLMCTLTLYLGILRVVSANRPTVDGMTEGVRWLDESFQERLRQRLETLKLSAFHNAAYCWG